jgi:hypothetical protein
MIERGKIYKLCAMLKVRIVKEVLDLKDLCSIKVR